MTKSKAIETVTKIVMQAVKDETNYNYYMEQAEKIADQYDIFLAFDPNYTAVEDEIFYHAWVATNKEYFN